jgi:hypothetical protein
MTNVQERLAAHYVRAREHYGEENILGVFLYGSWNYGTNLPDSDVDTKCILIPDLYHLAIKPYEVKHLDVDGEVCECMTIQHMVDNWKKQNINFLEILFTGYYIVNPKFIPEWFDFIAEWREALAHYDVKKAILSMGNQALHTYKQDPTDFKKQMNTYRIYLSLFGLITGSKYWDCIHFNGSQQNILQIIRHQGCSTMLMDDVLEWLHCWVDDAEGIAERFYKEFGSYNKTAIDEACNDLILSLIKKQLIWSGDV